MTDYYAVAVGRQTGIYTSWGEASKAVLGYSNAVHKKFKTLNDAIKYARAYGAIPVIREQYSGPNTYPNCKPTKEETRDEDDDDVDKLARALSRVLIAARKNGQHY
jgi:viroplasmin and RNaseH domain-containing protein